MKILMSESDLVDLITASLDEQEEAGGVEGGGVDTGISDAGGTGARQWESGLTRGTANPAGGGVTHWADSYPISRGKANPLNESRWYNTLLDVVGIVDPTGAADAINAVSYFRQGDMLYGMLSLISVIPYVGDLVAKPFIGIMKFGKVNKAAINAGLKTGNAAKVAKNMGKTKEGKAVLEAMGSPQVTGFLGKTAGRLGKLPFLKSFSKDVKTYGRVFSEAAKLSAKGVKNIRIFRSGGLLTRMQRKGLLNRTKLWSKFIGWLLGFEAGTEALDSMSDGDLNGKFQEFLRSKEGEEAFDTLNVEDQGEMVNAMQEQ